jgi:hypothetical protein
METRAEMAACAQCADVLRAAAAASCAGAPPAPAAVIRLEKECGVFKHFREKLSTLCDHGRVLRRRQWVAGRAQ